MELAQETKDVGVIPKISVCVFVRDNNVGAFALWESMASLIHFADEYVVLDLGSTDGTLEILQSLAASNPKIRIEQGSFSIPGQEPDASIFATRANDVVAMCKNDLVLYHQSDEIWHEVLLERMRYELEQLAGGIPAGWKGMNFWRYQLRENFQRMGWWPHPVNRLDLKSRMNHVGDGMNTDRPWDPPFVGDFNGGATWEASYKANPPSLPTHHMILDVGRKGGFLENIYQRSVLHAPFWHEAPNVDGKPAREWVELERHNLAWNLNTSPFNIPKIMRNAVGDTRYRIRPEVLDLIANG